MHNIFTFFFDEIMTEPGELNDVESYSYSDDFAVGGRRFRDAYKNKQRADTEFKFARRMNMLDRKYPKFERRRDPRMRAQYERELAYLRQSRRETFAVKNIEEAVTMSTDKLFKWIFANVIAAIVVIVLGFFAFYYWKRARAYFQTFGPLPSDIANAQALIEKSQTIQHGAGNNMVITEVSRKNGGNGFVW